MNAPAADDWLVTTALWLAAIAFAIVSLRNIVAVIQLIVAVRAFRRRVKPARRPLQLWSRYADLSMAVSVIAPCFNEELFIVDSVKALLGLQYPNHEVIVVNDESTDNTLGVLIAEFGLKPIQREKLADLTPSEIFGIYGSTKFPNLIVVDKANGRKADAVNGGLQYATTPLICVIDADSIIEPDGLLRSTEPFMADDGSLVAVGGAIRVINDSPVRGGYVETVRLPKGWLPRFQLLEYLRAFLTARVAMAELNMLVLISGAFGIFRRSTLVEIGGYRHDSLAEDFEVVTRLHRHMREQNRPYRVEFIPEVVCWTEVPFDYAGIRNQRTRWQQGGMETLRSHRKMLFNPRYGRVGMVALPLVILEDIVGPPSELMGYLLIPLLFFTGLLSGTSAIAFFSITLLFGTALSLGTLALEETQLRRTPSARDLLIIGCAAALENFGYRQFLLYFRIRGIWKFFRKERGWAAVPRAGFTRD
ncbi:glycosyltransferase family 2 protein [Parasphingopyxis marina]|uniref:Glycosyltransferase family 2 protein n=1 Tax=Parasphingopyxis marina TaxID=2761622 RepID=A0A842I0D3_9SPHN|nr:glycosyltransferase [Parasphingopyxis marina]MBC2778131.1 glycosyltransferase family 2 protein [Parasphingopyxis marina]